CGWDAAGGWYECRAVHRSRGRAVAPACAAGQWRAAAACAGEPGAAAVDGVGFVHAHWRGRPLPAAVAALGGHGRELPRALRAHRHGSQLPQQPAGGRRDHAWLAAGQHPGRLRLRQAALPRPRAGVPAAAGGPGGAGPGGDAAAVPADEAAAPGQHLRRRGDPGAGQRVRHLPGAPVRALDPRRAAGGGADRRGGGVADLLLHRPAHAQAGAGDAGDLLLHGRLDRLHVAGDRAHRPGALHPAGGPGHALARAHHGRGTDDGRRGGHGAAGAAAVPVAAALLHPGPAAGQRQGIGGSSMVPVAMRGAILLSGALALHPAVAGAQARVLDGFEDPAPWRVVASDQVSGAIGRVEGARGGALCLDYDFNGVPAYAGIQRDLPLEYPDNYRFSFHLRGDSPANDLQFKLVDASGDNVFWVNRPRYDFPADWTEVRYRTRHIDKAWGPDPDRVLRRSAKVEFTIYNNAGGRGSVCFDELALEPLPPDPATPPAAVAVEASTAAARAGHAIDGARGTAWEARGRQRLLLDLGQEREFGGLVLRWADARRRPQRYAVELEDADGQWRTVRTVEQGRGDSDWLALPEAEARRIALRLEGGRYALAEAQVQPLEFSAHPNDFIKALARELPRGWLPRGFSGEQPYWTII